ncbi:MAG: TetR/AcrR family transcriptional regulator, partial [Desulfobacterales bacterium]|nr:TetR/AcrR family transcriptional regulator [Desulfobacterales bacterium]
MELYASLNLKFLKVFTERIENIRIQNELDPEEKVKALEKVLYELYDYDPLNVINVLRFQSSEALRNLSPQLSSQIKDGARKYLRAIAGIFQDGVRAGIFSEYHPIAFADIVWGLYAGLVLWEHTK